MGAFYSWFLSETEQADSPPDSRDPSESLNTDHLMPPLPLCAQPDETSQVDKINFTVKCAGKSETVDMFPLESISVLLEKACEWARKNPEKMKLIFDGSYLDVTKTVSQYPKLRGGTTLILIHA